MYCYNCMSECKGDGFCPNCMTSQPKPAAPHHLPQGVVLKNRYVVGNALGEGGFGITYIGRDTTLDVKVAIKEFFPSGYANRNTQNSSEISLYTEKQRNFFQKGKARFLQEARSIAKFLDEPGIVNVRDFFEENSTAYIIMEYLDGESLKNYVVNHGVIKADEMFRIMMPIMSSLNKMHTSGIIHRDISPDNIMFLKNGTLKLMDFGSARYFTNDEKEMSVVVKRGYTPEEQYRQNGNQGPWTDVYGMCATMYRCITGKVPDDGLDRTCQDTLVKPSALGVEISPALESVLMYGMAVFKDDRCKNMAQLMELTQRAFANQQAIAVEPAVPVAVDENRTQAADDDYATQYSDADIPVAPTPVYHQPVNYPVPAPAPASTPAPVKPKKKKFLVPLIIGIAVTAILLFTTLVGFVTGFISISDSSQSSSTNQVVHETISKQDAQRSVVTSFSRIQATSTLNDQSDESFAVSNLLFDDETCWSEGVDSVGVGESVTLYSSQERAINGIMIVNGYAGTAEQYDNNGKVRKVLLEFSDGTYIMASVNVLTTENRKSIQYIDFGQGDYVKTIYADSITVKIEEAVEGDKYSDTCITYLVPYVYE